MIYHNTNKVYYSNKVKDFSLSLGEVFFRHFINKVEMKIILF